MEQHEIDTFIVMAKRQHEDSDLGPEYWIRVAMMYAYNLGYEHGRNGLGLDPWEHEDDKPF